MQRSGEPSSTGSHAPRCVQSRSLAAVVLAVCAALVGCSHFHVKPSAEYVYVAAKQTTLRDRVAAVSNRVATVENGDRLQVIERGRHYVHVKNDVGETGWIAEKAVATQDIFDGFQSLANAHKNDPTVATAVVDDEVNLHVKAGRETETLYRLPEKDKLQLLERATLAAPVRPGAAPTSSNAAKSAAAAGPPPIPMEDWWLVRDQSGHTGWLLAHMVSVDAPDPVVHYAEGARVIGAYVLARVYDPGAGDDYPDKNIPLYLALLAPLHKGGLPYDFDQVRVFTWNLKMHRYETAFRDRDIEGFLPVKIASERDPYGKSPTAQTPSPTFTYRVLAASAPTPVPDPASGVVTPGRTIAKTYRLEGNLVRRLAPPGYKDEPEAHPAPEEKKAKPAVAHKRR